MSGFLILKRLLRKIRGFVYCLCLPPHIQSFGKAEEICQLQGSFLDKLPKGRGSWAWFSCTGLLGKEASCGGNGARFSIAETLKPRKRQLWQDIMWLDTLCIGDGLGRHLWSNLVLFLKKLPSPDRTVPALKKLSDALSVSGGGHIVLSKSTGTMHLFT